MVCYTLQSALVTVCRPYTHVNQAVLAGVMITHPLSSFPPPPPPPSQELQLAHIRHAMECQMMRASSKSAYLELEEVKSQIDALLWKQLPSETDQAKLELVR